MIAHAIPHQFNSLGKGEINDKNYPKQEENPHFLLILLDLYPLKNGWKKVLLGTMCIVTIVLDRNNLIYY